MKREQILMRLGYSFPKEKRRRVILSTDLKNEADDQYAVLHHLLTPAEDVMGIVAAHFEWFPRLMNKIANGEPLDESDKVFCKNVLGTEKVDPARAKGSFVFGNRFKTMEKSYEEGKLLLDLMDIDDVPLLRGAVHEIERDGTLPESEGADFIIQEALREDARPLYVCVLGSITDVAVALSKAPEIADRFTVIWIGGGPYPAGNTEFNLCQDIKAANIVFESPVALWQATSAVYSTMKVSFAELEERVAPCGKLGRYLVDQLYAFAATQRMPDGTARETWSLGDSPTLTVLMDDNPQRWELRRAPLLKEDATYGERENGKMIRVYQNVDVRLTLEDMYAKLKKCYGSR